MNKNLFSTLLPILFVSLAVNAIPQKLPFFDAKELTPYWEGDASAKAFSPAQVVSFHVVDQDAKVVDETSFKKKPALVNFFFAQCPSFCPMMMQSIRSFQKELGSRAADVMIYSFSVTPEDDTPEVLRNYAKKQSIDLTNWKLLTGDQTQIFSLGKGVFKADGSVGAQRKESSFIHTANIYLLDTKLRIRGIYDTGKAQSMKDLAADLNRLKLD